MSESGLSRPSVEAKSSKLADSLLKVNQLGYAMPPEVSVATAQTFDENFFQQTSSNDGGTVICEFQSGSSFVDPMASYFVFDIVATPSGGSGTSSATFGESPAEGSSSNKRAGSVISAMLMASICLCPPLRVRAR